MGAISKLHNETYRRIKADFPEFTLRENKRPSWLVDSNMARLEIDIFIEDINTAIEIQGEQHYEYSPYFHKDYNAFEQQQRRDQEKRDLCLGHGVRLVEIACFMDMELFIKDLKRTHHYEELVQYYQSRMVSEKFRKERKARYHRKKKRPEGWTPPPPMVGLPGSKSQKQNSLKLFSEQLGEATWKVWGGNNEHIVVQITDKFTCDCEQYQKTGMCVHILRIMRDIKASKTI